MFLLRDAPGGTCVVKACHIQLWVLMQGLTMQVASVLKIRPRRKVNLTA